jgi:hypothetical protein
MVLNDDLIVDHRSGRGSNQGPARAEPGCHPDHVICLPFTRRPTGSPTVELLVDASCLPIDGDLVGVTVENLERVARILVSGGGKEKTTVAPTLSSAFRVEWSSPFHMQLIVAELPPSLDVSRARLNGEQAVADGPPRWRPIFYGHPFLQVLAIKENYGVRGKAHRGKVAGPNSIETASKRCCTFIEGPVFRRMPAVASVRNGSF